MAIIFTIQKSVTTIIFYQKPMPKSYDFVFKFLRIIVIVKKTFSSSTMIQILAILDFAHFSFRAGHYGLRGSGVWLMVRDSLGLPVLPGQFNEF